MKGAMLVAFLIGLMLAACDEEDDHTNGVVLRNDSGAYIVIGAGDEVTIILQANPSTGYQWEIDPAANGAEVVDQVGEAPFEAATDKPGSGGKQTFTFKASAEGSALLRLKYWRSFEPDTAPLRTFEVNVTVEAR